MGYTYYIYAIEHGAIQIESKTPRSSFGLSSHVA
jgi:hypothetical protein